MNIILAYLYKPNREIKQIANLATKSNLDMIVEILYASIL